MLLLNFAGLIYLFIYRLERTSINNTQQKLNFTPIFHGDFYTIFYKGGGGNLLPPM